MTDIRLISSLFAAALVAGCGGGGGVAPAPAPAAPAPAPGPAPAPAPAPAPTSFTISTSVGSNGTISPASKTVPAGETASFFVVSPNAGYRVASASGCGGDFETATSNTWWAGKNSPINADCTITATFEPMTTLSAVAPRFPGNGAKWSDYVVGNSTSAADLACNAATNTACVHGGEQRLVVVTGKTSCTDLSARDDLEAFTWHCQIGTTGTAQFISSTGLSAGKHLSDLIDFTLANPAFKPNKVTVFAPGGKWSETPASQWWPNNPILKTTASSGSKTPLSTPSTIYVLTSDSTGQFTLDVDKVALVIQPGVTLRGPGNGFDTYVVDSETNASPDYVWLEGKIDATGDDIGVNLVNPRFSALRNVQANRANGGDRNTSPDSHNIGILVQSGTNNRLEYVTANGNFNAGIVLSTASRNTISGAATTSDPLGTQRYGIRLRQTSQYNTVSDVTAGAPSESCSTTPPNGNTDTGVWLGEGATNNTVRNVKAYCNQTGVSIADSTSINNVLANITANSNRSYGVSIVADSSTNSPNTFETLTANNNGANSVGAGLYLEAVSGSKFTNVTANNNDDTGIFLNSYFDQSNTGQTFGSNRNTFTAVEASGNTAHQIRLDQSSASRDNTFTGVSPATNCPLPGTNNSCSTAPTASAVVEFRIAAGTAANPWNTQATMLTVTLGQTVRIINDDTTPHAFHADNNIPCTHQPVGTQLSTGQSYDCLTTAPVDPGAGPPTTWDHLHGPGASFWLKVVP